MPDPSARDLLARFAAGGRSNLYVWPLGRGYELPRLAGAVAPDRYLGARCAGVHGLSHGAGVEQKIRREIDGVAASWIGVAGYVL